MDEIRNILSLLNRSFEQEAWHGPSVKEVLENITEAQYNCRFHNSHSITELVTHMTAWRTFVIKKLTGDLDYEVTDDLNFPPSSDWPTALANLYQSQLKLLQAIEEFPTEKLADIVPGRNYNYYTLIHGIIHHDIYHIAQIQLLKKAI